MVLNKTENKDRNLIYLNTKLNENCISYFEKAVKSKMNQGKKGHAYYDSNVGHSVMPDNKDISDKLNQKIESRQLDINSQYMPQPARSASEYNSQYNKNSLNMNSNMDIENNLNVSNLEQNRNSNRKENENEMTILPFTVSDDIISSISSNNKELPLYQNVSEMINNDDQDPMMKMKSYENQRNLDIIDYNNVSNNQQDIANSITTKAESNIVFSRNNTDAETKIDQTLVDPKKLHTDNKTWQDRMNQHVSDNVVNSNLVENLDKTLDGLLQQKLIKLQRDSQPDYIEKVNYISVNSVDRKWESSNEDDRYSYQVKFNASDDFTGAGINRTFKNVLSVELVSAIMPIDSEIVPFDTRIHLNIMKYPYLLLNIDEFNGIFMGTNLNTDKAFTTLIFDKFHNSDVLSSDQITSNVNSTVKTSYSNEYKRGYIRFNPAYFEKKKFYNNPLASLNKLSINITDPMGNKFNTQSDVLDISNIEFSDDLNTMHDLEGDNKLEINITDGFPNTNDSSRKMIKITTTKHFSNRLFRIGDKILIKNCSLKDNSGNNNKFEAFLNRIEGHIIINLEKELYSFGSESTYTTNQGQINQLYISPPGDLDSNNEALNTATYYDTFDNTDASFGKLINTDLQTHLLFRIVTRDTDVVNVTNPMNI